MRIKNNRFIRTLYFSYRNFLSKRSYNHGRNNHIKNRGYILSSKIQIEGSGNHILIENLAGVKNALIHIKGDNNRIIIKEGTLISGAELWIEDNRCQIDIGANTFIGHKSHLACTEDDSYIFIGKDCMISSNVHIRTGDSHSILDENGNRINYAKSVNISNHCWVGEGAKILKGVTLGENSVVTTGSIVTKSFNSNSLIGGSPAKEIKQNISWNIKRL